MRRAAWVVVLLGLVATHLAGCAAVVIAGAAGAGLVATDGEAGAKVKGFFQALDEAISRQIYGIEKTKRDLGYKDGDGLLIRLTAASAEPKLVQRGGSLAVTVRYALLGTRKPGAQVRIKQTLWQGKNRIVVVSDNRFERTEGTWEEVFTVPIPEAAQSGTYAIGIDLWASDPAGKHKSDSERRVYFDVKA